MRIYKLLIVVFVSAIFLIFGSRAVAEAFNPYRPLCLGIQGKFSANNKWKGGAIQVGCAGDSGSYTSNQSQKCTGEVQTVKPGQAFRLTKCSCFGKKGCLKIGKELKLEPLKDRKRLITVVKKIKDMPAFKNNSCRVNDISNVCGSNGKHIKGNVRIRCTPPTSPTPRLTVTPTPRPSLTPTPGPTVPPTPSVCINPDKVTNVKVSCSNCFSGNKSDTQAGDINWKIKDLFLSANNPYIQIGNTKIKIKNNPTLDNTSATIYKVGNTYKAELSGTWIEFSGIQNDDVSMLMSLVFSYTPGGFWKVTEITTSDGTRDSNFIKYGPKTKSGDDVQNSIGDYYINNGSATEFVSADEKSTIHFENLQIGAFLNGVSN